MPTYHRIRRMCFLPISHALMATAVFAAAVHAEAIPVNGSPAFDSADSPAVSQAKGMRQTPCLEDAASDCMGVYELPAHVPVGFALSYAGAWLACVLWRKLRRPAAEIRLS